MKNMFKVFGIIFIVIMIGMIMISCDNGTGGGGGEGGDGGEGGGGGSGDSGSLIFTGLDDHIGMYAAVMGGDDNLLLLAAEDIDFSEETMKVAKISEDGSVALDVWDATEVFETGGDLNDAVEYSGDDKDVQLYLIIFSQENLDLYEVVNMFFGESVITSAVGTGEATVDFDNGEGGAEVTLD